MYHQTQESPLPGPLGGQERGTVLCFTDFFLPACFCRGSGRVIGPGACRDIFLDGGGRAVYDTARNGTTKRKKGSSTMKEKKAIPAVQADIDEDIQNTINLGNITLATIREAMRELGIKARHHGEGAKKLLEKAYRESEKNLEEYREINNSINLLLDDGYKQEAAKKFDEVRPVMNKICRLKLIQETLKAIAENRSVALYLNDKGLIFVSVHESPQPFRQIIPFPAAAIELSAFKKLLPKQAEDKQFSVLLSESSLRFYMSHGAAWKTVEGMAGGVLSGGGYEGGRYCKIKLGKKASDKRAALIGIAKDVSITPETCKLFMALCSGLNDANLQSGGVCIWNREHESVRRDVIIDLGALARAISPNDDRRAVSRVKKKLQEAKDYLQTLKTGIVTTDREGNEYSGACNVFETIGEHVEGKNRILARFTQTFIDEVLRGSRKGKPMYAQIMGDCAYSLSGFNVSLYLFESLSYQNTPPGEWRQIKLTDALSWLGYTPNRRIHNSLYDDVLRPLNAYIQETEEKGLASHSIARRGEDGRILELTEADKMFLEGREPCNTYHSWKDLDSYVLMYQLHGLKKKLEAGA